MLGTFLLLDGRDLEIDQAARGINTPKRHRATPVISEGVANFSNTVMYGSGLWRMWFIGGTPLLRHTAYTTSRNGWTWSRPIALPNTEGMEFSDIIDTGKPGLERYMGFRKHSDPDDRPPRWRGELTTSPDGVNWNSYGPVTAEQYGETWQPLVVDGRTILLHRWNIKDYSWVDSSGMAHTNTDRDNFVRCLGITSSLDPHQFPPSTLLFAPGPNDPGETQFYSAGTPVRQGQFWVGFLHGLRDDKKAAGSLDDAYGMGETYLMWSRNGLEWQRSYEPYFSPNPAADSWDHAVAWIDSAVIFGGEMRLFYGGYQHGHKVFTDRKLGYVKTRPCRFMWADGLVRTLPFENVARSLFLNLDGVVKVRALDENNNTLRSTGWITANNVNRLAGLDLGQFRDRVIKLEFEGGRLYSYRLVA